MKLEPRLHRLLMTKYEQCPKTVVTLVLQLILLHGFNSYVYSQGKINRKALVQRHNVVITQPDSLSSLSVGNGKFAFTVDMTGLQSFPESYERGIPLGTQSEWGWHSFIDTAGYRREEALKTYMLNGRAITYSVEQTNTERNKNASNWFRQNPHRLQLGNLGFEILKNDKSLATISDIKAIQQQLNLWTGEIKSEFTVDGIPVNVSTFCHQQQDVISVRVISDLIRLGRLKVFILFPYPTGQWTDAGTNYNDAGKHHSAIISNKATSASVIHQLDTTRYFVDFSYSSSTITQNSPHHFLITPAANNRFEFSCRFSSSAASGELPSYAASKLNNETAWQRFWTTGAAVDFSGSKDKRAFEIERRVILSQYLIKIQETASSPPQETGLTYNSWFGKPHIEMHYWHMAHYPFWGYATLLDRSMDWYFRTADKGRAIAKRQGFEGIRWQKMTDNNGDETPSSVGALLIWQQPHLIYFAESLYREGRTKAVLEKYKELVFATADFMASYPYYEKDKDRYILGKGVIPAQERFKAEDTFNPTYELVYWHWALDVAQQWRVRSNLPRHKKWDEVLEKLSSLPVQDKLYLATESATDSYTNPRYKTDHPSVLMAYGVMPATGQVDEVIMKNTFNWIWDNWSWKDTWGWDFPMVAMTATRLGMPEKAMDALLMNLTTNTYLINGHNYQSERLRLYLPGNGALLIAIAMMCAGYDGAKEINPGIPKNKGWKVRWEGLRKLP
jgi:protein-glucosylgalactosylhydroxylysine glucosidase